MDNIVISDKFKALAGFNVFVDCDGDSYSAILKTDQQIALLMMRGAQVWVDLSSIMTTDVVMAALRFCRTAKEVDGTLWMWVDVNHPHLADLLSNKELKHHLSLVVNEQFMAALSEDAGYAGIEAGKMWTVMNNVASICFNRLALLSCCINDVKNIDLMQLVKAGDNGEYLDYKGLKGLCNSIVEDYKENKKVTLASFNSFVEGIDDTHEKELMHHVLDTTREKSKLHVVLQNFDTLLRVLDAVDDAEIQQSLLNVVDETCASHCLVSKVSLAKGVRKEEQRNLCMTAWQCGCDYFCLIPDSSAKDNQHYMADEEYIVKRPPTLEADVVRFQNKKEKWIAFVGLIDGRPYEVFTGIQDDEEGIFCPKSVNSGKIIKALDENGQKRYDFQFINKRGFKTTIEGLSEKFNPEFWNYAKLISGVLRYGMPLEQVVKLVSSLELDNQSINNWKSGVIKALKKYLPNIEEES